MCALNTSKYLFIIIYEGKTLVLEFRLTEWSSSHTCTAGVNFHDWCEYTIKQIWKVLNCRFPCVMTSCHSPVWIRVDVVDAENTQHHYLKKASPILSNELSFPLWQEDGGPVHLQLVWSLRSKTWRTAVLPASLSLCVTWTDVFLWLFHPHKTPLISVANTGTLHSYILSVHSQQSEENQWWDHLMSDTVWLCKFMSKFTAVEMWKKHDCRVTQWNSF